jgi:hypothetical protein
LLLPGLQGATKRSFQFVLGRPKRPAGFRLSTCRRSWRKADHFIGSESSDVHLLASGARSPFDYHRAEVGDVDELVTDCTLPRKRLSANVNMTCRKPISGSCREMSIRPPELEMLFNFPNFSQ